MKLVTRLLPILIALLPMIAFAVDADKGEQKAFLCLSCHGVDGIGVGPLWPNLAGQKPNYLIKQMMEFRSGKRADMMMVPLMKNLSDEDIANLAAYYSQLGIEKAPSKK